MSQRNIADLPRPNAQYRVDRVTAHPDGRVTFETLGKAREEDQRRANGLRAAIRRYPDLIDLQHAVSLAAVLEQPGKGPDSPASSRYMRAQRVNVIGGALPLIRGSNVGATTGTVIPRGWEYTPEQLASVNPISLLAGFRTDLYRAGAAKAGGWMIAFIHGEFDPGAVVVRLHVHCACSLEMVPVLDRLRKVPKYKSSRFRADGSLDPVFRRVWVRRKPLDNMPAPITYIMQAFWPSRPIYFDAHGARHRVRDKRAIPEPYNTQILLWLDRWQLKDLSLLIGLRVTRFGLIKSKRKL